MTQKNLFNYVEEPLTKDRQEIDREKNKVKTYSVNHSKPIHELANEPEEEFYEVKLEDE